MNSSVDIAGEMDERQVSRNTSMVILSGGFVLLGSSFASHDVVVPAYVQTLTDSSWMVGLTGALLRMGWVCPQIFVSRWIEPRARKKPIYLFANGARGGLWLAIGLSTFLLQGGDLPGWMPDIKITSFLTLYCLTTTAIGIANVPMLDVIGKAIPPRIRARSIAYRRLLGSSLAVLGGVLVSYILSERSALFFPDNYALLFVLAGLGMAAATLLFSLISEPTEQKTREKMPLKPYLSSLLRLLQSDANYRRLCMFRSFEGLPTMAASFYVPFAISVLRIRTVFVGIFVATVQIGRVCSNILWAYVGHRHGSRALLVYGSYVMAASVVIPLLTPFVPDRDLSSGLSIDLRVTFFCLSFFLLGSATSGLASGRMSYVLDIAPPGRRPTYTSFLNLFMLPQVLAPLIAAWLVTSVSYSAAFLVALVLAAPAVLLATSLTQQQGDAA